MLLAALFKIATAKSAKYKSPIKSRGVSWKNTKGEILFSLDNAETPKQKRAAYKNVQVKLENKGKIDLFKKCTSETGDLC